MTSTQPIAPVSHKSRIVFSSLYKFCEATIRRDDGWLPFLCQYRLIIFPSLLLPTIPYGRPHALSRQFSRPAESVFPFCAESFYYLRRQFSFPAQTVFITNFVTLVRKFVTAVTKFVTHIRNFVIKISAQIVKIVLYDGNNCLSREEKESRSKGQRPAQIVGRLSGQTDRRAEAVRH